MFYSNRFAIVIQLALLSWIIIASSYIIRVHVSTDDNQCAGKKLSSYRESVLSLIRLCLEMSKVCFIKR